MNLFSFFCKPSQTVNPIKVDIHSHLLPGIDDGVKTLSESISIIKKFKLLGYSKLIITPHVISDYYPNTKEIINQKLQLVKNELERQKIEIILEASAEYYLDMEFLNLIEEEELIPFMGNYILFETPCKSKPIILEQAITDLLLKGYIPVLAHPERYHYLHEEDISLYKKLKRQGVLFQVNLKSLHSKSKHIQSMALKLIKSGLVDFIGSDAHRMKDIINMENIIKSKNYKNILIKNKLLNNS
jgi:tyrosine-protein phosphatase YwqE